MTSSTSNVLCQIIILKIHSVSTCKVTDHVTK